MDNGVFGKTMENVRNEIISYKNEKNTDTHD